MTELKIPTIKKIMKPNEGNLRVMLEQIQNANRGIMVANDQYMVFSANPNLKLETGMNVDYIATYFSNQRWTSKITFLKKNTVVITINMNKKQNTENEKESNFFVMCNLLDIIDEKRYSCEMIGAICDYRFDLHKHKIFSSEQNDVHTKPLWNSVFSLPKNAQLGISKTMKSYLKTDIVMLLGIIGVDLAAVIILVKLFDFSVLDMMFPAIIAGLVCGSIYGTKTRPALIRKPLEALKIKIGDRKK